MRSPQVPAAEDNIDVQRYDDDELSLQPSCNTTDPANPHLIPVHPGKEVGDNNNNNSDNNDTDEPSSRTCGRLNAAALHEIKEFGQATKNQVDPKHCEYI